MRFRDCLLAAMVAAGALAGAARAEAAAIYTFVQTGSTTPDVTAGAAIVLSDEAYAAGGSYRIDNGAAYGRGGLVFAYDGLLALDIGFLETGPGRLSQSFDLADFLTPVGPNAPLTLNFSLNLANQPSGALTGSIVLNNPSDAVTFSFGSAGALAFYGTGAPSACNNGFGCRFSGQVVTTVAVPEPASLSLLGLGAAALGVAARRGRRRAT